MALISLRAALMAGALLLMCRPVPAAPPNWVYTAVDPDKVTQWTVAALDAQDFSHLIYGRDALYYDWEDANGWHSEVADATVAPHGIAMVLNSAGKPAVAYVDRLTHQVKYANRTAAGWTVETIGQTTRFENYNRQVFIVLDSSGWPHVTYLTGQYPAMVSMYVTKDASGWHTSTFDAAISAMGVADDGQPHLGGMVTTSAYHAWRDGSGWHSAAGPLNGYPRCPSLFDGAGRLHMVIHDDNDIGTEYVSYVTATQGTFRSETLYNRDGLLDCSLAVTRAGVPHVAFAQVYEIPIGLQHWSKVAGVWQQTSVDTSAASTPKLALGAGDRPHLLYRGKVGTNYVTKSAWQDGGGWHIQVEPSGPAGWNSDALLLVTSGSGQLRVAAGNRFYSQGASGWSERVLATSGPLFDDCHIAVDGQGRPHLAYAAYGSWSPEARNKYAWRDDTGWHTTVLVNSSGSWCDLAVDSQGRPHMAYKSTNNWLTHAVLEQGVWQATVADTNSVWEMALAVDSAGHPHLITRENASGTTTPLVHLWQDDGGWHKEPVRLTGRVYHGSKAFPSIAVDHDGRPHVCYFDDQLSNTIQYGYRSEAGWQFTTVDASSVDANCSLALDGQDRPHVAYSGFTAGQGRLKYAWKDAAGWHISTVGSSGSFSILDASLSLAPDGKPQIAYAVDYFSGGTRDPLRYARLGANGWEVVDMEPGYIPTCSLAVDHQGRPHIAYSNRGGRDNLSYLYAAPYPLKILAPFRQVDGKFSFQLTGEPGLTAIIQASPDLEHWTTLGSFLLNDEPVPFTDTASPLFPQRFYRLVEPEGSP